MNLAETVLRKFEDMIFRIALQEVRSVGINTYTFGGLDYLSDKFATLLTENGISRGDVVAVILPQSATLAVAHLGILKTGAIVLPISSETEQQLIEKMLGASNTKSLLINETMLSRFSRLANNPSPFNPIYIDSDIASKNDFGGALKGFWYEVNYADANFKIVDVDAASPAYLFFDQPIDENLRMHSLTHGDLIAILHKVELPDSSEIQEVFWTAEDWASKQIIIDMIFKKWFQGNAIASYDNASRDEEDAEKLFEALGYDQFTNP
jgi:hypothetical protein